MRLLLARLRCALRGQHEPVRHHLGGWRCAACDLYGTDLAEMGFDESDSVSLGVRHVFSRVPYQQVERVSEYAEARGPRPRTSEFR